jgi:DNA-directed RNA polymerase specialized sigma24 family protein
VPVTIYTEGLPPLQATTKYLAEEEGRSDQEIALLLDKPAAQINNAHHHARKKDWRPKSTPYHIPLQAITKENTIMAGVTRWLKRHHDLTNEELATILHKRKHSIDRWLRTAKKR